MKDRGILRGVVVSGAGQAAYFTQLAWVQEQCFAKLHFSPYPGTLNVQVNEDCLSLLADLQNGEATELLSPVPDFCNARALPARLDDVPVAVIVPAEDVRIHGANIIEVIAPVHLKDVLSLHDGDQVELVLD